MFLTSIRKDGSARSLSGHSGPARSRRIEQQTTSRRRFDTSLDGKQGPDERRQTGDVTHVITVGEDVTLHGSRPFTLSAVPRSLPRLAVWRPASCTR